jgi:hypothetical protein
MNNLARLTVLLLTMARYWSLARYCGRSALDE